MARALLHPGAGSCDPPVHGENQPGGEPPALRPGTQGQSARTAYEGGEPLGWVEIQRTWKFVDRANHGCLMAAMARARADKRMMKLIRAFLENGGN